LIGTIGILYGLDIMILLIAGAYGIFCAITTPNQYINPMLQGRRAWVGVIVAFIWFYNVTSLAKTVYAYFEATQWDVPMWILVDIAFRQGLAVIGTILTGLLLGGYQFGDKKWQRQT
jgi:hypothetical protein